MQGIRGACSLERAPGACSFFRERRGERAPFFTGEHEHEHAPLKEMEHAHAPFTLLFILEHVFAWIGPKNRQKSHNFGNIFLHFGIHRSVERERAPFLTEEHEREHAPFGAQEREREHAPNFQECLMPWLLVAIALLRIRGGVAGPGGRGMVAV